MNSTILEKLEVKKDYQDVDWKKVIPVLMAYSYTLISHDNDKMKRSMADLSYDYTMEAIKIYLDNPEKFDPTRNSDLINYLKYNVLRQLISNGKKSAFYNREGEFTFDYEGNNNLENQYIEEIDIDSEIDVKEKVLQIERLLIEDSELAYLFQLKYHKNSKRSEICQDLNIDKSEYDNRMKRLRRIIRKVIAPTDNKF
jgi:hypothetical protein